MLIHAATGGVGLVAVQYAQRLGAEAGGTEEAYWFPYEFGMIIWGPWDECHPM